MSDEHESNIVPVTVVPDGWLQVIAAARSVSDGRRDRAAFEVYFNPTTGATLSLYWTGWGLSAPTWTWRLEQDRRREEVPDFDRSPPNFTWADAVLVEWLGNEGYGDGVCC